MSWEVITGDCLVEMSRLIERDITVDACIADIPYGTTACAWDTVIPFKPMWDNLKKLVKRNGAIVLFGSQPFTSALVTSNPQMFKYSWVWIKSNAGDCMNVKNKPMKKHEDVNVFSEGTTANCSDQRMPYFPQGLTPSNRKRGAVSNNYGVGGGSFKTCRPSHKEYVQEWENYPTTDLYFDNEKPAIHPTQKPVDLMRYLIRTYSNEGDTILDFTCGSGTTGVACAIENRNFIGIEKDSHYAEVSRARITRATGIPCDIPRLNKSEKALPLFSSPIEPESGS